MIEDLEARLLAAIPDSDSFSQLQERGLTAESFSQYQPMYYYIEAIVREHHQVPRLRDLRETFQLPDYVKRDKKEFNCMYIIIITR